jgi:hypothetical protein
MNRAEALKRLRPILGKRLAYQENPKAPVGEAREDAREHYRIAVADFNRLDDEREKRRAALLAADPEYQRLRAACAEADRRRNRHGSLSRARRLTVGYTSDLAGLGPIYHQKAEGDNWQEIVDQLTTPP